MQNATPRWGWLQQQALEEGLAELYEASEPTFQEKHKEEPETCSGS